MTKARIKIQGESPEDLKYVIDQLNAMSKVLGIQISGIIRLPRKNLIVATRRTPCGDGSDTYERWWKVTYTWFVDIDGNEKALRQLLRIKVPENVYAKIIMTQ